MANYYITLALAAPVEVLPTSVDSPIALFALFDSKADHGDFVHARSRNNVINDLMRQLLDTGAPPLPDYLLQDYVVLTGEALRGAHRTLRHFLLAIEENPTFIIEATREPYAPRGTIHTNGWPHTFEATFSYSGHKKIEDGWCYWHDEQSVRQLFENALPGCRPKARDGEDDGDTMQYLIAFLKSHLALLAATMARDLAFAFQKLN